MQKNIKVIVFDLDGTLVDTMGAYATIAADLISSTYGLSREKARAEYLRTSGQPFFKQLNMLFPNDERNAEIAAQFEMNKLEVRKTNVVDEDTRATLLKLKERFKLAISSNNYEKNVVDFAKNENLNFDFCLGYRTGISSKGKKHFNFLRDTLKIQPQEILFAGDSLHDAKVAKECGVNFIAKLGTFSEADFKKISSETMCVNKISEIVAFLN